MRWRVAHTRLRFHCCPRHPTGLDGVHALRGPAVRDGLRGFPFPFAPASSGPALSARRFPVPRGPVGAGARAVDPAGSRGV